MANVNNRTYICEFTYATQKGLFSPLSRRDEFASDSLSNVRHLSGQSTRGTAAVAKELAEVLLDAEANIPKDILPTPWVSIRQAWLYKTKNAKTIKEVAHSLLDLEDGVRILIDRSLCPKDQTAWRKTVSGIHTYDLLAKYVKIFNLDVQHSIMNSVSSQHIRGMHHHDQGLESKRKYVPDTNPKKLHKIDGIHPSFQHDPCINSSHSGTRPVSVEVLPLSSRKEILVESIYKVDQEYLPLDAPTSLKCLRAVMVAEKTRFNVTVTFPSVTSLQSYFGRAPYTNSKDQMLGTSTSLPHDYHTKTEACMGTKPEFDGYFNMTPKVAERVLIGLVSCTEYLHQGHLWSFWVNKDLEEVMEELQYKRSSGDEDVTARDYDLEDEAKGELGAAEALTQLIPRITSIICPDENRTVHEASNQYGSEEPTRSQVRWGIRSLRKASFGNRSGNGTSPNSCDTGTKDSRNKGRKKVSSRKILDFPDQQHQNIGRNRISHDYMPTERSSRMHSRREEKLINLGAVKCLETAPGKSENSFVRSNIILKLPKDMKGRWASERYKSAQLKLIDIMHKRGAAPGKPILRPALREEARKDIGDTGLLDHLLKHMTDTVVTNGERFRRRHNAEGAMEYWLEDASLMEIRKAAGIEDPSWIPPPGWKPGDALPGRGEYGYGCFNRVMTLAEVVQMKKLKESVDKVKSGLQSLALLVKRSRSREVTPEQNGLQDDNNDTATEKFCVIQSNFESKEVQRMKLKEKGVHGELLQKMEQGDQNSTEHQKSICESREGRSTGEILTETKSQLETDLSEVQQSLSLMQGYVDYAMTELGLSEGEDIKHASKHINSDDGGSRPISTGCHLLVRHAASASPGSPTIDLDKRNCCTKASSVANRSLRTCSEENDSRKSNVDFAVSVGSDPKRFGLFQSNARSNKAMQEGFRVCNPSISGRFVRPGMEVPQTGAFGVWAEDDLSPGTLPPAVNTSSCIGHNNTEISCDDASARVIYSIAGPDDKNLFRPYFRHHTNLFSSSTDSEVDRKSQSALYPVDHRPEGSRVKGMTAEGRNFQLSGFHQANYHSEAQALAGVRSEPTQARDGFSFAARGEGIDKLSQEPATVLEIQSLLRNRDSTIAKNLTFPSSSAGANPTRGHSASGTSHAEARKRRMLHHFKSNISSTPDSIRSSTHAVSGDSSHNSLSAVPAAQCDRSESFKPSVPMANLPFDTTLTNTTTENRMLVTSTSKEIPRAAHMLKDPWTNLSLTSHMSPGPSSSGSPSNTFSRSVSGRLAEPSSTSMLSTVVTTQGGGNFGQNQLESLRQVAEHALEQRQVFGEKNFLEASDRQKSFPEIVVIEKYSTQSSTSKPNSSTWLGLAPPASSNLHS